MQSAKNISIITLTLSLLIAKLNAQAPGDHLIYQDTLQQRMQRSASRQLEAASRMQASIDVQRRSAPRQTGDVAQTEPFFTLPPPARMAPRTSPIPEAPQQVDPTNDDSGEHNNGDPSDLKQSEPKPAPSRASDVPPAHLMPLMPIGNIPIPGIPGIPEIAGIVAGGGIAGNYLRTLPAGKQAGNTESATATNATVLRNAGIPYLQQLMQSLGGNGSAPLPSLLGSGLPGPEQSPTGTYSGRDNAPLTSFSLVDWLFGL
jgi:hypothetical protein